jgi:hypothetical protein
LSLAECSASTWIFTFFKVATFTATKTNDSAVKAAASATLSGWPGTDFF